MGTPINELSPFAQWVFGVVSADTVMQGLVGDRMFRTQIPTGANLDKPAFLFSRQGGQDKLGAFGSRLGVKGLYQMKGVCTGNSYAPITPIGDAIERLFSAITQVTAPSGLVICGCVRVDQIEYQQEDDNVQYSHYGGLYRVDYYMPGTER